MYESFQKMIEGMVADPNYDVTAEMNRIADTFGIGHKTAYTRFHSYFGTSPKKHVRDLVTPSKAKLTEMILNTGTVSELWDLLPRPSVFYTGLFDQNYGVSTYKKAKVEILKGASTTPYVVTREDNRSLIYSQLLGDGSYDDRRHALRISHGIKQAEYLKAKVTMMTKAYPNLYSEVKIHTHTQGHQYASWYSGSLGNVDIPEKKDYHLLVEKLTPIGWLLWWLDDGWWAQNVAISICNADTEKAAIEVLATYGIAARPAQNGSIQMRGEVNDMLFYNTFIAPLRHLIPACMMYKVKI